MRSGTRCTSRSPWLWKRGRGGRVSGAQGEVEASERERGERTDDGLDILSLLRRDVAYELDVEQLAGAEGEREGLVEVAEVEVDL